MLRTGARAPEASPARIITLGRSPALTGSTTMRIAACCGLALGGWGALGPPAAAAPPPAEVRFNRDVRPILSNRCFKCHGPDLKRAGLDLQSRDGAVKVLKS